jgi:hypothetical protein
MGEEDQQDGAHGNRFLVEDAVDGGEVHEAGVGDAADGSEYLGQRDVDGGQYAGRVRDVAAKDASRAEE